MKKHVICSCIAFMKDVQNIRKEQRTRRVTVGIFIGDVIITYGTLSLVTSKHGVKSQYRAVACSEKFPQQLKIKIIIGLYGRQLV